MFSWIFFRAFEGLVLAEIVITTLAGLWCLFLAGLARFLLSPDLGVFLVGVAFGGVFEDWTPPADEFSLSILTDGVVDFSSLFSALTGSVISARSADSVIVDSGSCSAAGVVEGSSMTVVGFSPPEIKFEEESWRTATSPLETPLGNW